MLEDQKTSISLLADIKDQLKNEDLVLIHENTVKLLRETREVALRNLPAISKECPLDPLRKKYRIAFAVQGDPIQITQSILTNKKRSQKQLTEQLVHVRAGIVFGTPNVTVNISSYEPTITSICNEFKEFPEDTKMEAWEYTKVTEAETQVRELGIRLQNLRKEEKEVLETREKLKHHRYDPNCKFCCENPFVQKAQARIQELPKIEEKIHTAQDKQAELTLAIKIQKCLYRRNKFITNLEEELGNTDKEIVTVEESLEKARDRVAKQQKHDQMQERLATLKQDIVVAEQLLEKKQKLVQTQEQGQELTEQWIQFSEEFAPLLTQWDELEKQNSEKIERLTNLESRGDKIVQYQKKEKLQNELVSEKESVEEDIRIKYNNKDARTANQAIKARIADIEKEMKTLRVQESEWVRKEAKWQLSIKAQQEILEKQKTAHDEFCKLKQEVALLKLFVKMTHHNGIPAFLLRKITRLLEDAGNEVLSQYSDMRIKMKNEGKETTIRVKTPQNSSYLNAKMLCGSEKFLVELAFRVAFQLLSNISKPNFMVCDEGWSCLDESARSKLRHLLSALLEHNDYILTVSHIQDVKAWMNQSISIEIDEEGKRSIKQV
jgi:DNA repair exonuclease SbcCD ATPase subunit